MLNSSWSSSPQTLKRFFARFNMSLDGFVNDQKTLTKLNTLEDRANRFAKYNLGDNFMISGAGSY
jgi:hypothetical protein